MNSQTGLRQRLREATSAAHLRLHTHPGLAAASRGEIGMEDYARLMERLFGFHRAFERAMASAAEPIRSDLDVGEGRRSRLITDDLLALGLDRPRIEALPLCERLRPPADLASAFGAFYVVQGSTLGGAQIAKALERAVPHARRFFLGFGEENGRIWRDFLARLEQSDDAARSEEAAVETFEAFESWMQDWNAGARAGLTPRSEITPALAARAVS